MITRRCEEVGRLLLRGWRLPQYSRDRERTCGFSDGIVFEAVGCGAGDRRVLGRYLGVENANLEVASAWRM